MVRMSFELCAYDDERFWQLGVDFGLPKVEKRGSRSFRHRHGTTIAITLILLFQLYVEPASLIADALKIVLSSKAGDSVVMVYLLACNFARQIRSELKFAVVLLVGV